MDAWPAWGVQDVRLVLNVDILPGGDIRDDIVLIKWLMKRSSPMAAVESGTSSAVKKEDQEVTLHCNLCSLAANTFLHCCALD